MKNQLLSHLRKNKNFYAVLDVVKNEQKNKNKKLLQYNRQKKIWLYYLIWVAQL